LASIIKKEPGSDEGLDLIDSLPNPLGDEPHKPGSEQPASPQDDGGASDPEKPENPDGE
jgi:hypothetical protein